MPDQQHASSPPPGGPSFGNLNDAHDELEDLFLVHQECLLVGAFANATELLAAYRDLIELHIAHEEQRILPIYDRAEEKRWPAELYTGQHKKILAQLDRIALVLEPLELRPAWRRDVLAVLDIETALKHLLEHHHLAEDQVFYPVADAHASDAERRSILEACQREWTAATSRHADALARGRSALT